MGRFAIVMASFGSIVFLADSFVFLFLWGFRAEDWLWLVWLLASVFWVMSLRRQPVVRAPLFVNTIVLVVTWLNGAIPHGAEFWHGENGSLEFGVLVAANIFALLTGMRPA